MTSDPVADARRIAGIEAYDVLGKPPRTDLLSVLELAARVCGVPMATINLITDTEQHQIASFGFEASVCSREDSMCAKILDDPEVPIVVADAREDDRFRDNPFVTGDLGHVRFYAAHRLVTPDDVVIGTLCVFDEQPRELDVEQRDALHTLAERVSDILDLSLRERQLSLTLARVESIRDQLQASNDRLASFAGQVSHDLKTPLTGIYLALDLLREEAAPGTEGLLDRALRGAQRMNAMIDNLLGFAKLGGSLKLGDVDLGAVLNDVRDDLGDHLLGVDLEIPEPLPVVCGDATQLRAVLQNLLSNSVKFSRNDRTTRIAVRHRTLADGGVRVEVVDNGRGVPADERDRVFEPLARADKTEPGFGIGLATCRRIIEAHGGRIGLDEAPGGAGTLVWFEVPAA